MTFPQQRGQTQGATPTSADPAPRRQTPATASQPSDLTRSPSPDRHLSPRTLNQWARDRIAEMTADTGVHGDSNRCTLLPPERASGRLWQHHPALALTKRTEFVRDDDVPLDDRPHDHGDSDIQDDLLDLSRTAIRPYPSSPQDPTEAQRARPDLVRKLATILSGRHHATVHALYDRSSNRWSLAWEHPQQAELTRALLTETAATDDELEPLIASHDRLRLGDRRLDLIVWARRMALLESLVNPDTPITAERHALLRISEKSRSCPSPWTRALPRLRRLTRTRAQLTYHESYDCNMSSKNTADCGSVHDRPVQPSLWSRYLQTCSTWWQGRGRYGRHVRDRTRNAGPAGVSGPAPERLPVHRF